MLAYHDDVGWVLIKRKLDGFDGMPELARLWQDYIIWAVPRVGRARLIAVRPIGGGRVEAAWEAEESQAYFRPCNPARAEVLGADTAVPIRAADVIGRAPAPQRQDGPPPSTDPLPTDRLRPDWGVVVEEAWQAWRPGPRDP